MTDQVVAGGARAAVRASPWRRHASLHASINKLSDDVVPASNTARFLIFSAVIVLAAATVIIATKGDLGRAKTATTTGSG